MAEYIIYYIVLYFMYISYYMPCTKLKDLNENMLDLMGVIKGEFGICQFSLILIFETIFVGAISQSKIYMISPL